MNTLPNTFKVGDHVKRRKANAFRYHRDISGIIVEVNGDRNKIKWSIPCKTGQQHSTIQSKFLELINS